MSIGSEYGVEEMLPYFYIVDSSDQTLASKHA